MNVSLETELGDLTLRNPIILASGTAGFGIELAETIDLSKIGAIVTKTLTASPREGNPPPRIWETECGMINSIGLENPGIDLFIKEIAQQLEDIDTKIVVSIGGENEEEFAELAHKIDSIEHIAAIELNLSCPNVKRGGIQFGQNPRLVEKVVLMVKKSTDKPIWAKLTPQVSDIVEIAKAAEEGGASAVVVGNTIPAMAIDIWSGKPRLGAITGGLSGPAIHPVAVELVFKLHGKIGIPIIGCGGVTKPEDAVELMLAGASAVQIGTATFIDHKLPEKTTNFIANYLEKKSKTKIGQIIGQVIID